VKQLEDSLKKIGQEGTDNRKFRLQISEELKSAGQLVKDCKSSIDDYSKVKVPGSMVKEQVE